MAPSQTFTFTTLADLTCWAGTPTAFELQMAQPFSDYALEQLRARMFFATTTTHDPIKSARAILQMALETEIRVAVRGTITVAAEVMASKVCERRRYLEIDQDMQSFGFLLEPALQAVIDLALLPEPYVRLFRVHLESPYAQYRMCAIAALLVRGTYGVGVLAVPEVDDEEPVVPSNFELEFADLVELDDNMNELILPTDVCVAQVLGFYGAQSPGLATSITVQIDNGTPDSLVGSTGIALEQGDVIYAFVHAHNTTSQGMPEEVVGWENNGYSFYGNGSFGGTPIGPKSVAMRFTHVVIPGDFIEGQELTSVTLPLWAGADPARLTASLVHVRHTNATSPDPSSGKRAGGVVSASPTDVDLYGTEGADRKILVIVFANLAANITMSGDVTGMSFVGGRGFTGQNFYAAVFLRTYGAETMHTSIEHSGSPLAWTGAAFTTNADPTDMFIMTAPLNPYCGGLDQ